MKEIAKSVYMYSAHTTLGREEVHSNLIQIKYFFQTPMNTHINVYGALMKSA